MLELSQRPVILTAAASDREALGWEGTNLTPRPLSGRSLGAGGHGGEEGPAVNLDNIRLMETSLETRVEYILQDFIYF